MSFDPGPPDRQVGAQVVAYAVDLFYRAAEAALDPEPMRRREADALFALARKVMAAAEAPESTLEPLVAAVSCPTARLRSGHAPGWA
jgi:hypothetical protein